MWYFYKVDHEGQFIYFDSTALQKDAKYLMEFCPDLYVVKED